MISKNLKEHILAIEQTVKVYEDEIYSIANSCIKCLESNGKIIILGNGGSAADAQHMAAELVGNFSNKKRPALAAIAITTDSSTLTSISNDYSYEEVFSRQLQALAMKNDVVIGISTSGKSKNVVNALKTAKEKHCFVVGISGNTGGNMNAFCDKNIIVPSANTSTIQEVHLFIEHNICAIIDDYFIKTDI